MIRNTLVLTACTLRAMYGMDSPGAGEANPPRWPASVKVFGPETPPKHIDRAVLSAYGINGGHVPHDLNGEFSDDRFAFLFKPGTYTNDVPVGYYTQVMGLGTEPSDVVFDGMKGVYCEEASSTMTVGALMNFWRAAENFRSNADWKQPTGTGMLWAVSQAAPLRRIEVANDLLLFQYEMTSSTNPKGATAIQEGAGYASGGYCADMTVGGKLLFGSQQQWFARNSRLAQTPTDGVWNIVYGGVENTPQNHCSNNNGTPNTVIDRLPVTSSKPFITIDADGKYNLVIPEVQTNSRGPQRRGAGDRVVSFSQVYVTQPGDSAAQINAKLAQGLHVVVSPAIYELSEPLVLQTPGQVLLGLGLATLIPVGGDHPAIRVGNIDGVRVAGVLVQAGPKSQNTDVLVEIGDGQHAGDAVNPTFLHDLHVRVGGPGGGPNDEDVSARVMVRVRSGNVVGDNMWLWRADHSEHGRQMAGAKSEWQRCSNGITIEGDDVTMYGLAVEHTLEDLTQWTGERGRTYFYQSELPYYASDADSAWASGKSVGYRVGDNVKSHEAWGVGVYSYFKEHAVRALRAISCPQALESSFHHALTVKLGGDHGSLGGITNVINNNPAQQGKNDTAYFQGTPL